MKDRRTVELGRLSWKEVAAILPLNPVILIPVGTVEQHGPHMPVNADNMVADFVARRAAEATGAYVIPAINYGVSALFRNFPGTFSVQPETLTAVLRDVCHELVNQGFRRIIFVNNHGGNQTACEQVARELKRDHGLVLGSIYPWVLGYALMRDTYDDAAAVYGHGGEPETSAMLAMFPDDVRLDLMSGRDPNMHGAFKPRRDNTIEIPGQPVGGTLYLDFDELFANGASGDPSVGTAERGQIWIERIVGYAVAFVQHYENVTAGASWARRPNDPQVHNAD
ncbi:MAG TPA: creatininase family protein [Nitrolancea sp.]|nr:creatininase family protein [Nitrolancea sp.]